MCIFVTMTPITSATDTMIIVTPKRIPAKNKLYKLKHNSSIGTLNLLLPSKGIASGVGGNVSPIMRRKTTKAKRIVNSRFTFSPLSIGKKKPIKLHKYISKQGNMRLNM